ncbi:MAG: glycerol kinase GlpK [Anaerolineae bacterium]|nr:glycerol kinase GlpK [Anaerolineae bacterium]
MSAKYVAALDQGTTSTRCMIFDHASNVIAAEQVEHRQILPRAGWVEHDPLEIWERTQEVIATAMAQAKATPSEIAALGITNQRETTVVWDKHTGQPLHPAIVWQDTRTDGIVARLSAEGGADRFREKTGLPISTYFSATKLIWLLENVAGLRAAAQRGDALFGTIDSWLIWNMTGGQTHVTDVTNASRTLLMNLKALDWDDELLKALNIPRAMLPKIRPSSDPTPYGSLRLTGGDIPITGILGDQQAALYGQTCFSVGEAKNTYGTGNFMLINTGTDAVPSKNGLLTTLAYKIGTQPAVYALEGSIAVTGSLVQWLRDNLGIIRNAREVEDLARTVPDNGGIYFVPAFSGLFAPYWRSDARGVIVGMTRYVNKGHFARAALEATAYQTREVVEAMRQDSGVDLKTLKVDGGMTRNNLLMQFQADILGVPVVRPIVSETTALGAAYAAGLATGFWSGEDDLRKNWGVDQEWTPHMDDAQRETLFRGWKKAIQRTFEWVD